METVAVSLGEKSYSIYIEENIFARLGEYIGTADKWFVLTDENVDRLYGDRLTKILSGLPYSKMVVPAGEMSKNFQTVEEVINAMVAARITRHSTLIAFGGGVVGDLAGFCASIYMRGIRYVQIPTTLLAQVDSSVGGKTGVDVRAGKNMAGTFYQPQAVIIDTALLKTLPKREFTAGLGEVIKYGIIYDYKLLAFIEDYFPRFYIPDFTLANQLISRCCQIKAEVVAHDEKECGLRKILNFGHTFGHALEALTGYRRYLHGEAVLIGMYYETMIAQKMGLIDQAYGRQIAALIRRTGISVALTGISAAEFVGQMTSDKKNSSGEISFILPVGKGKVAEYMFTPEQTLTLLCDYFSA